MWWLIIVLMIVVAGSTVKETHIDTVKRCYHIVGNEWRCIDVPTGVH